MIDLSVFTEPRGFIKVLQFIFVICAFSCTCDFRGAIVLTATCPDSNSTVPPETTTPPATLPTTSEADKEPQPNNDPTTELPFNDETTTVNNSFAALNAEVVYSLPEVPGLKEEDSTASPVGILIRSIGARFGLRTIENDGTSFYSSENETMPLETVQFRTTFKYPFNLEKFTAAGKNCSNHDVTLSLTGNYSSPASFYVFVGVSAFLYTLMAVALYTYFKDQYELEWVPVVDLAIHFAYTIMWFAGSIAWAVALTAIKSDTGLHSLMEANPTICTEGVNCTLDGIKWQLLDFSVVFGFLNFVLYLVNMWFIFKETTFYAKRTHSVS